MGKDVALVLGYTDTNQAIRKHVDAEDKGVVEMTTPGGVQQITAINESGLYSLILSSKLLAKYYLLICADRTKPGQNHDRIHEAKR